MYCRISPAARYLSDLVRMRQEHSALKLYYLEGHMVRWTEMIAYYRELQNKIADWRSMAERLKRDVGVSTLSAYLVLLWRSNNIRISVDDHLQ
jgi:hypothetical protein